MKKLNLIATLIGFISILNVAYSQSFIADETKLYHATYKGDYTKFDFSLYENYRIGLRMLRATEKI